MTFTVELNPNPRSADERGTQRGCEMRTMAWMGAAAVLAQHPRARARLLLGGLFTRRSHAEALLAVAGVLLAGRDRRAALLAAPWLHERLCLTPAAGGNRRRCFVLPGVLAFDVYDATLATAARMRSPQEH